MAAYLYKCVLFYFIYFLFGVFSLWLTYLHISKEVFPSYEKPETKPHTCVSNKQLTCLIWG